MSTLTGRCGWTAVVSLATVLSGLVAVQLPLVSASATPAALVRPSSSAVDVDVALLSRRPTALPPTVPAAAVVSAPASAPLCSRPGWQQRRGQAALASLRDGAGRAGFDVVFAPARPGYLGLTHPDARRIEVFVRTCDRQSSELLRHVLGHEVGHAHDTGLMGSTDRAAWLVTRGIPAGTPWYGCSGCTDFATPAGDFAEVYAQWSRGATTNRSQLAGDVPAAQLDALATRFFR